MWRRLDDPELLSAYRRELTKEPDIGLVSLLRAMAQTTGLWAVTSLGILRFTTASNFADEEHHDVVIVVAKNGKYIASYFKAGQRTATHAETWDLETLGACSDAIRAFLLK